MKPTTNPQLFLVATGLAALLLAGCGGLPESTAPTGAIVVFGAFDGPDEDAQTIRSVARVVIGGVVGQFDGPAERELILRDIPFGNEDPPVQPMTVTAPGYLTVSQKLTLREDIATFVDLTMTAVDLSLTGTVSGVVRDTTGQALVNALVTFTPDSAPSGAVSGFTDYQGAYVIGGIPTGSGEVEAVAAGYLSEARSVTVAPDQGGTNGPQDFALIDGETRIAVEGIVKDQRLETPLEGAQVTVTGMTPVSTGADGRFRVPDVLVGKTEILIELAGYDDYEQEISVLPGLAFLEVLLSRSSAEPPGVPYTIRGTVTLLGQAGNAGAVVTAYSLDRGAQLASYTTGADGAYYLFVPAGRYTITATFGARSISRDVTYLGEGRTLEGIDFTLSATTP